MNTFFRNLGFLFAGLCGLLSLNTFGADNPEQHNAAWWQNLYNKPWAFTTASEASEQINILRAPYMNDIFDKYCKYYETSNLKPHDFDTREIDKAFASQVPATQVPDDIDALYKAIKRWSTEPPDGIAPGKPNSESYEDLTKFLVDQKTKWVLAQYVNATNAEEVLIGGTRKWIYSGGGFESSLFGSISVRNNHSNPNDPGIPYHDYAGQAGEIWYDAEEFLELFDARTNPVNGKPTVDLDGRRKNLKVVHDDFLKRRHKGDFWFCVQLLQVAQMNAYYLYRNSKFGAYDIYGIAQEIKLDADELQLMALGYAAACFAGPMIASEIAQIGFYRWAAETAIEEAFSRLTGLDVPLSPSDSLDLLKKVYKNARRAPLNTKTLSRVFNIPGEKFRNLPNNVVDSTDLGLIVDKYPHYKGKVLEALKKNSIFLTPAQRKIIKNAELNGELSNDQLWELMTDPNDYIQKKHVLNVSSDTWAAHHSIDRLCRFRKTGAPTCIVLHELNHDIFKQMALNRGYNSTMATPMWNNLVNITPSVHVEADDYAEAIEEIVNNLTVLKSAGRFGLTAKEEEVMRGLLRENFDDFFKLIGQPNASHSARQKLRNQLEEYSNEALGFILP